MILSITAVIVLLAANAFFVAAEFALVKVRGSRVQDAATRGSSRARVTLHQLKHIEAYLAACQLGITMASLGLGWVGEPVVAAILEPVFSAMGLGDALLHTVSFITGFLIFSALHIVVGEQVPKTMALRRSEPTSLWVAWPLHAFFLVCWPLNWALNSASRALLRALGIAEASHLDVYSAAEMRGLIDVSAESGVMRKHESDMLGAVLDLDEVEVAEVMTHRRDMRTLDGDAPAATILQQVMDGPFTRYPVWSGDQETIIGILHAKDALGAAHRLARELTSAELRELVTPPWFVPDTTALRHQLLAFRQRREHLALVVDEYGAIMGLVTLEDILEEIVGDISDEKDLVVAGVKAEPDGTVVAEGRVTIRDLNRQFDWDLPDDEATTLAGLVMHEARRIPEAGESFTFHGFRFDIMRRQRHQITLLRIKLMEPSPAAEG